MNSLIPIDKNNLSLFLENYVDTGVKIIDSLDLFKEDGLVASVPYGKLVGFVAKQFITIKNPNEALKKVIALSHVLCLTEGAKKYNIDIRIDEEIFL